MYTTQQIVVMGRGRSRMTEAVEKPVNRSSGQQKQRVMIDQYISQSLL